MKNFIKKQKKIWDLKMNYGDRYLIIKLLKFYLNRAYKIF